jgi:N-formylglutamate deformylase
MLFETPGTIHPRVPLLLTIPHSGEEIPQEAFWLEDLPKEVLLRDVDRFVDELYQPAIEHIPLPAIKTRVHRYAADLNRYPTDVDASSVEGSRNPVGKFPQGFHWMKSTVGEVVLREPIPQAVHDLITRRYHDRFHDLVAERIAEIRATREASLNIYHLDLHSMPSQGTGAHADQGRKRPEVVLSDFEGRSCNPAFMDLVRRAFETQKFEVSINWPYKGGRITQRYGRPEQGHHTIQIELNRSLYMNEESREKLGDEFLNLQQRLQGALVSIVQGLA